MKIIPEMPCRHTIIDLDVVKGCYYSIRQKWHYNGFTNYLIKHLDILYIDGAGLVRQNMNIHKHMTCI